MSKYSSKDPNLVNDQMRQVVASKVSKSSSYADTNTNLYVDMFANEGVLIPEDERRDYLNDRDDQDEDEKLDDETDNYKTKELTKVPSHIFHTQNSDTKEQKETKKETIKNVSSSKPESYNDSSSDNKKQEKDLDDESQWTKEELMLRKLDMLRKLGELAQCKVKLSQNYSMDSDYNTMKFEYDLHTGIRAKQNSINWMSNMMIGIVKGIEMLNDNANPFDIKFDNAWSNKVTHDINDYYDVIGDIYEKYTTPGKKMAPELKLFLMLSGSAINIQMYKGLSKSSNTSKNLDSDPEEVKKLRKLARNDDNVSRMSKSESKGSKSNSNAEISEKSSEYKRKEVVQNKINKEHKEAMQKAIDLQKIKNDQLAYEKVQAMAKSSNMSKLNKGLEFSESARSFHSKKSTDTEKDKKIDLQQYKNEVIKNKKLIETQKLLESFRKEENELASKVPTPKKQRILKGMKESSPVEQYENSDESGDDLSVSSSSSISMNPKISDILGPVIKAQKQARSESSTTPSSSSSVSSSSSKKGGIVVDSDEIRSSDRESRKKNTNVPKFDNEQITRESISFGKKSNDSGSTSKRGRPRKDAVKISFKK
jgi:hypothetical protein